MVWHGQGGHEWRAGAVELWRRPTNKSSAQLKDDRR